MKTNGEFMEQQDSLAVAVDFSTMLHALAQPQAFPFALPGNAAIQVVQTHASAVLLVADRVYKLKKPHNFGFFDYSTPALRRHFCGQEVLLNRRLAPRVYLGVSPVLAYAGGTFRFGPTFSPETVPVPGVVLEGGHVVDYAVVMVRLPDEATLENRVNAGTATPSMLAEIARTIAKFHAAIPTNEYIASFGKLEVIRGNWEETFEQMKPFIGRALHIATYSRITAYIRSFLNERSALFASRVRDGCIRDCHGDLRLQHVYLLGTIEASASQPRSIVILDGIEFNERFRYSDVTCEVAFLAMELDAVHRPDLSRAFIDSYVAATEDDALRELLPFYCCYRACVRGKVTSFQLDETEVPSAQRDSAGRQAEALFDLAASYTYGPMKPTLLMVGGLMGTGKSTLALALQHELGWALISSDAVRKHLARLHPTQPQAEAFGQGIYSPAWTARTYDALFEEARSKLADGRSVLLDATFLRRSDRQAAVRHTTGPRKRVLFVECTCPREVALQRLGQRWKSRVEGDLDVAEVAPDLYDAQASMWEDFVQDEEPESEHVVVSTTQSPAASVRQVLDSIGTSHSPSRPHSE